MWVLYVEIMCASRFGLGWAYDVFVVSCHMFMHFSCISTFIFFCFHIVVDWYFSTCLSLSFFRIVYVWHPSIKLLCPRTLFVLGHHLLLILPLFMLGSVMIKPVKTFRRTFLGMAFIQNARSTFRIFLIMTYPLSFTVGVRSPFMTSRSAVPPWSYRSFTPICMDLITLYLAFSLLFEVYVL